MASCLFCDMIQGKVPVKKVYETETVLAFHDINPQAPVHILIIPKTHIAMLHDAAAGHRALLGDLFLAAGAIAAEKGLQKEGYRVVVNNGGNAGQAVFHIHLHLLGGRKMAWPPG